MSERSRAIGFRTLAILYWTGQALTVCLAARHDYANRTHGWIFFDGNSAGSKPAHLQRRPGGAGGRYHPVSGGLEGADGRRDPPAPEGLFLPTPRRQRLADRRARGMGRPGFPRRNAAADHGEAGGPASPDPRLEI